MSGRKRRSPEQIVATLREADALLNAGQSVAQVIQHLAVQLIAGADLDLVETVQHVVGAPGETVERMHGRALAR